MNLRKRLLVTGTALVVIALLTIGIASLYVWLAPQTYSAQVRVSIRPASALAQPIRLQDLPLGSFKHDRNLKIENPRNSSLFGIIAFASTPEAAADLANKRMRELEANVRSQLKADVSLIEPAAANPRPVRPNRKAILTISGLVALNLAFVGVVCLLVGFVKSRRSATTAAMSVQTTA